VVKVFDEAEIFLGGGRVVDRFENVMPRGLLPSACPVL
jgi:hypothetical protein